MADQKIGVGRWMAVVAVGLMILAFVATPEAIGASVIPCPKASEPLAGFTSMAGSAPSPLNPCPGWEWAKTFGDLTGSGWVYALSLDATSDNGAVLFAHSDGNTPSGSGAQVVRIDANGTVLWQRSYDLGSLGSGESGAIQQTSDGGFIFATRGWVGFGGDDVAVYRLDAFGGILWQKVYGGAGSDTGRYVEETSDGGFVMGGETDSFGAGGRDFWVLRLDSQGDVIWQRTYGGPATEDFLSGVHQTQDGGYIVGGTTLGPKAGPWVAKLDSGGGIVWQKLLGGSSGGALHAIRPASDGGYALTMSAGGKWTVVKLASSGSISWQKTYGTTYFGRGSLSPTADGGFVATASVPSPTPQWDNDIGVLRINAEGARVWQRTYGGALREYACGPACLEVAEDGNFLVAGQTHSFTTNGVNAAWLLRMFTDGSISSTCDPGFGTSSVSPTVSNGKLKAMGMSLGTSTTTVTPLNLSDSVADGALDVATQCAA